VSPSAEAHPAPPTSPVVKEGMQPYAPRRKARTTKNTRVLCRNGLPASPPGLNRPGPRSVMPCGQVCCVQADIDAVLAKLQPRTEHRQASHRACRQCKVRGTEGSWLKKRGAGGGCLRARHKETAPLGVCFGRGEQGIAACLCLCS